MHLWELLLIALSLSMDAFAVSVCKGLSVPSPRMSHSVCCGTYFGSFQALMPVLGWLLGIRFQQMLSSWSPLIVFVLLSLLGMKMVRDSRLPRGDCVASFSWHIMLPLAIATSIDALALGVSLAFLQVEILPAVALIGATTFLLCAVGVQLGGLAGSMLQGKAELFGGLVLIGMAVKTIVASSV